MMSKWVWPRSAWLAVAASLALTLAACGRPPTTVIRVGALPMYETLPFFVAQQNGYFKAAGLNVQVQMFNAALDRDTAMESGQLDVNVTELLGAMVMAGGGFPTTVVAQIYQGQAYLLSAPHSSIRTVAQLAGVPVASAANNVVEYDAYVLATQNGLPAAQFHITNIPNIPQRVATLLSGGVQAAVLTQPFAGEAIAGGAHVLATNGTTGVTAPSVIAVAPKFLQAHPAAVRAVLAAYQKAVLAINANPQQYLALARQKGIVPANAPAGFQLPHYPDLATPAPATVQAVLAWAQMKGLLRHPVDAGTMITADFLPASHGH